MPNGGSDCCGTCVFNAANGGKAGYPDPPATGPARCTIRDQVEIPNPFWTYCANHPHHNPRGIRSPVGPIYSGESYPAARTAWRPSPDTEELRAALVALLESLPPAPAPEYPSPTRFEEELIRQLAAFKEKRAVPGLRRLIVLDPDARPSRPVGPFEQDRRQTMGEALLALAAILGDAAIPELRRHQRFGLDLPEGAERYGIVRYLAVLSLRHCSKEAARPLLEDAAKDPHPEVAALARTMIDVP